MCGRFVQFSSLRTLESYFQIDSAVETIRSSYNIAPTQEVLAIDHQNERRLEKFRWGLVPSWSKDLKAASRLINARSETASQKPSFRAAFKRRRCLIVADGFYEWHGEKGHKQPFFITLPANRPFGFAGLWETWRCTGAADTEPIYKSCTILTTVTVISHLFTIKTATSYHPTSIRRSQSCNFVDFTTPTSICAPRPDPHDPSKPLVLLDPGSR